MANIKITERIDRLEALAVMLNKEAIELRKELGLVQVPTPRKGAGHKKAIVIVAKRTLKLLNKTA